MVMQTPWLSNSRHTVMARTGSKRPYLWCRWQHILQGRLPGCRVQRRPRALLQLQRHRVGAILVDVRPHALDHRLAGSRELAVEHVHVPPRHVPVIYDDVIFQIGNLNCLR